MFRTVRMCLFRSVTAATLLVLASCQSVKKPASSQVVQLNQGWSEREIQFYHHATEGTNLAPLEFVLHLPDPAKPGSLFLEKLSNDYGFIPSEKSALNPHGLPVGFAIDGRPKDFGDRVYLGLTCSMCHTRRLTYSRTDADGTSQSWILPIHGGPGLSDFQHFKADFYEAFFAVLKNDDLARQFAKGVLGRTPEERDVAALRAEIREFTGPVAVTLAVFRESKNPPADFGPGNLNALSQGNYNNAGLAGWLMKKGYLPPSSEARTMPRMEGSVNFPPMWFAPGDTWAQWFVEIHHAGPRNWVQSFSSSEVRPPKMLEAMKGQAIVGAIHFDNIGEIQRSLELLRTPKWPEQVFGSIDRAAAEQGRSIYEQQCARCHLRTVLAPNSLGIVFKERPAFDVGTDPTAYRQFVDGGPQRVLALKAVSEQLLKLRQAQLDRSVGSNLAANYMNLASRGRPNEFAVTADNYGGKEVAWTRSGAAYWAPPLDGIFASSPYFHNGSVRTLWQVLTPAEQREKQFRTGTTEFDAEAIGLRSAGAFLYNTQEPGKGNGGHPFGTDLPSPQKAALIEYLKSL